MVKRGKTPVLSADEARKLLDSIESNTLIGLRDRALIGAMVYSFARVGATVTMRVGDYFQHRKRLWLRLHEKGGKRHEVPCHPSLEGYLNDWITAAGITRDKKGPLFRSMGKGDRLGERAMSRFDVLHMIKRRAESAALPYSTCCHTFRATGITTYLQNGGTLEHAQTIANHESPGRPSCTIAPARNFRSTKWRGSESKASHQFVDGGPISTTIKMAPPPLPPCPTRPAATHDSQRGRCKVAEAIEEHTITST